MRPPHEVRAPVARGASKAPLDEEVATGLTPSERIGSMGVELGHRSIDLRLKRGVARALCRGGHASAAEARPT